jgi:hypothetical protein
MLLVFRSTFSFAFVSQFSMLALLVSLLLYTLGYACMHHECHYLTRITARLGMDGKSQLRNVTFTGSVNLMRLTDESNMFLLYDNRMRYLFPSD